MKKIKTLFLLILLFLFAGTQLFAQKKVYTVTSGELLFQWANIAFTDEFIAAQPVGTEVVGSPARFTLWFHLGQYLHVDLNNNFGILTGGAIRNVGFISDERLDKTGPEGIPDGVVEDYKIIRRNYTLGVPLALKFGNFKKHLYVYGGAEYELAFAFKEKYWNSHQRDGEKRKVSTWFADQSKLFLPSVYAGAQLPGGINVKFKYYLNDFLDLDYSPTKNYDMISDLTRYQETQVMYISVSWQFETRKVNRNNRGKTPSDVRMSQL